MIGERKCRACLADVRGGEMNADEQTPKDDVCVEANKGADSRL